MTNIPALNVRVNVDASGVSTGVTKATEGLNQISARASRLTGTLAILKTTMLGVFGGNILTGAVFAIGRELNGMKQETIKIVTFNRDFSQEDYAFMHRIVTVLQEHDLSVALTVSKDRHIKKLKAITLRRIDGGAL